GRGIDLPALAVRRGGRLMPDVAAFLAVAVIVIVTPGPDTALTIRNTLVGGRRSGVFTAAGVAAGQATWTVATSAGIAALLVASEPVFRAVRYLGALYLAYLGLNALAAAVRRGKRAGVANAAAAPTLSPSPRSAISCCAAGSAACSRRRPASY